MNSMENVPMRNTLLALYLMLSATATHAMYGPQAPNAPLSYLCSVLDAVAARKDLESQRACDILPGVIKASQIVPVYALKPAAECATPEELLSMYHPKKRYWKNLIRYLKAHEETIIDHDDTANMILAPYHVQAQCAALVTILTYNQELLPCSNEQLRFLLAMRFGAQKEISDDPCLRGKSIHAIAHIRIQRMLEDIEKFSDYGPRAIKAFGTIIGSQLVREKERVTHTLTVAQNLIGTQMLERSYTQARALLEAWASANQST